MAGGGGVFNLTENLTQQINSCEENVSRPSTTADNQQNQKTDVKVEEQDSGASSTGSNNEGAFDALYIKRLLNLFKEKGVSLSVAEAQ